MNDGVPDMFAPSTSPLNKHSGDAELVELLWQSNTNTITDRWSFTTPPLSKPINAPPPQPQYLSSETRNNNQLDIADDEMAAWLNYPVEDFYNEITLPDSTPPVQPPPQQLPLETRPPVSSTKRNFALFNRVAGNNLQAPLETRGSGFTVVDSSDTPKCPAAVVAVAEPNMVVIPAVGENLGGLERVIGSPGASSSAANSASPGQGTAKRKYEQVDRCFNATTTAAAAPVVAVLKNEVHAYSHKDLGLETVEEKKHARCSNASKRPRVAGVHNISEKRRRDKINEKMKTLAEIVPRCNKFDKASVLDKATEYMKLLQMQVQMMASTEYGMMPMMYPGMQQQYMPIPPVGAGMGMVPQLFSYPHPIPVPGATNPYPVQIPGMVPRVPNNIYDPYQQYIAHQQMQIQMQMPSIQSQALTQPFVSTEPTPSRKEGDHDEGV